MVLFVFEDDMVEIDLAFDRRQDLSIRFISNRDGSIHQFEDTFQIGSRVDHLVVVIGQGDHGVPEVVGIGSHGDQHTNFDGTAHIDDAYQIDGIKDSAGNDHGQRPYAVVEDDGVHVGVPCFRRQTGIDVAVVILTGKTLRYMFPVDRLSQVSGKVGMLVGLDLPGQPLLLFDGQNIDQENGQAGKYHQRQFSVNEEHEDGNDDQADQLQQDVNDAVGQKV